MLSAAIFLPSAAIREPLRGRFFEDHRGSLGGGDWTSLTALTVIGTRNWLERGPLASGFAFNFTAPSIENQSRESKYLSALPTVLLPPYLVARFSGGKAGLDLPMKLSLLWHYLLVLSLLCLCGHFLREEGFFAFAAVSASVAAVATYGFTGLRFFQSVWWPDAMVLPFLVAALWAEARGARRAVIGLLLCALLVDWLAFFFLAALIAQRILRREPWRQLLLPGLLASLCYWLYVGPGSLWKLVGDKLLERTGTAGVDGISYGNYFTGVLGSRPALYFLLAVAAGALALGAREAKAGRLRRKENLDLLLVGAFALAACGHAVAFIQHYFHHPYTDLKHVAFAALCPWLFWRFFRGARPAVKNIAAAAALAASVAFAAGEAQKFTAHRARLLSPEFSELYEVARFVETRAERRHLVFSASPRFMPDISPVASTEITAVSGKIIYTADRPEALKTKMRNLALHSLAPLRGHAEVLLLTEGEPGNTWAPFVAEKKGESEGWVLSRLRGDHFGL